MLRKKKLSLNILFNYNSCLWRAVNEALILCRCFIRDVVIYLNSEKLRWPFDQISIRGDTAQGQSWHILSLYSNCKWNLTATIITAVYCFSHQHVLLIFNMSCLLAVLFHYLLFVVDAWSLGSHHIWVLSWWVAKVFVLSTAWLFL